jgi:hypothetical protein
VVAAAQVAFDMSFRSTVLFGALVLPAIVMAELQVVVIEGLGGEARYAGQFAAQVSAVESAASGMTRTNRIRVFRNGEFSRDDVVEYFATLRGHMQSDDHLAVFLIGHGSFDDHEYKFNIAGPDLTDGDLNEMLNGVPGASQLLVNVSSSSGAILDLLKRDDRTLILATRSGVERHATRFGSYFATALSDAAADIDKNNIITADEAFQFAEREVIDYFARNSQLATEHSRIEGSQAARFGLARLGAPSPVTGDSELSRLITQRDGLNAEIEELRLRRDSITPAAYQSELLQSMLALAMLEEQIEAREGALAQ